jgi:hypothetical protein
MQGLRVHVSGRTFTLVAAEPTVLKEELEGGAYGDSWLPTVDGGSVRASAIIAIDRPSVSRTVEDLARAERRRESDEANEHQQVDGPVDDASA